MVKFCLKKNSTPWLSEKNRGIEQHVCFRFQEVYRASNYGMPTVEILLLYHRNIRNESNCC